MRAALFLGGEYPSSENYYLKHLENIQLIAAADSGAEMLRRLETPPHLLIGDMDSISPSTLGWCKKMGSEIFIFPVEKDDTDTGIALSLLKERGSIEVSIFGATGKRADHFVGTLFSIYGVQKLSQNSATIMEEDFQIGLIEGQVEFKSRAGEIWSFFPFGERLPVVSLEGFKYPLVERILDYSKPLGISNLAVEDKLKIACKGGALLYFRWFKEF